jgi:hypothetical protein
MTLNQVPGVFSVGRYSPEQVIASLTSRNFCAVTRSPTEVTIVTESDLLPPGHSAREDGWTCLQVDGILDFSLTGILAQISGALAGAEISLFAVSTFDTDYILVKEATLEKAKSALRAAGIAVGRVEG